MVTFFKGPLLSGGSLLSGGPSLSGFNRRVKHQCYFQGGVTFGGAVTFRILWYSEKSWCLIFDLNLILELRFLRSSLSAFQIITPSYLKLNLP